MSPTSPERQGSQSIQTSPARDVALQLHQKMPGIWVASLGTEVPPEHRTFGTDDDDALEHGEVLQITGEKGQQVRVLVSKAHGFPGERVDVLPDLVVDVKAQGFVDAVKAALSYESGGSQGRE
ncbi:MAG: hypothetical protein V1876_02445 [Candidatus Peregrinibacteria bacterium]